MQAVVELLMKDEEEAHRTFCPKSTGEVTKILLPISLRVNCKTSLEEGPETTLAKVAFAMYA